MADETLKLINVFMRWSCGGLWIEAVRMLAIAPLPNGNNRMNFDGFRTLDASLCLQINGKALDLQNKRVWWIGNSMMNESVGAIRTMLATM